MERDNTEKLLLEEIFDRARRGNKEALRKLERLADNKDAEALSKPAEIYLKGLGGTEQSPQKALELFKQAFEFDEAYEPGYELLGRIYREGLDGVKQDGKIFSS